MDCVLPSPETSNSDREPRLPPLPTLQSARYEICRGLLEPDLSVPPKMICHTGAIIVRVGGEIMVASDEDKRQTPNDQAYPT